MAVWPTPTSTLRRDAAGTRRPASRSGSGRNARRPRAVPLAREADDAARDEPGDLDDADRRAAGLDHEGLALVVLACLVEFGVEEEAGV